MTDNILKTVPLEIEGLEGITFRTVQFPAFQAMELIHELKTSAGGGEDFASMHPKMMLKILAGTSALVTEGGKIFEKSFGGNHGRENFDLIFSPRLAALPKVLEHAFTVNFESFKVGEAAAPVTSPTAPNA